MSAHRYIGVPTVLFVVASCATHSAPNGGAVAPKAGPKAAIHVTYTGGMLNRQADAVYKVEESAYVLVAHLGGDGRIEVLFPEDARESGYVPRGKWYRTPTFSAYYDAVPELYSFGTTRYRGVGAQMDSYDGVGHGYVFMIASQWPMRFDRVSDFGLWDDFEAEGYRYSNDPREAIRSFVDLIAGERPYTLQFARSMSTTSLTSNVDRAFDCAYLESITYLSLVSPWLNNFGSFGRTDSYRCGGSRYAYSPVYVNPFAVNPRIPGSENPIGTPRFGRPGFRPRGENGPSLGFNRPTHRPPATGTVETAFSPRDRARSLGPRAGSLGTREALGPQRDLGRRADFDRPASHAAERAFDATRSAPREMPRAASPSPSVERVQAQPSPRAEPVREHAQPTARPAPEEKKP